MLSITSVFFSIGQGLHFTSYYIVNKSLSEGDGKEAFRAFKVLRILSPVIIAVFALTMYFSGNDITKMFT